MLPMLIQLTEKDKRLIVALFIILIIAFVLIAYIGQGIRAIMRKHGKGIDTYMYDLCRAGLIKTPKDFMMQVVKREIKVLYIKTRWAFRVGLSLTIVLLLFGFIFKPSGEGQPIFAFYGQALDDLRIILDWPRGEFFGIENFIVDWPTVARWPSPEFSFASIITYLCTIGYGYVVVVLFIYVTGFIGKLLRAKDKSTEVFTKDLDGLKVDLDEVKNLDNINVDGNDVDGAQ
jgi:hypothetical protein